MRDFPFANLIRLTLAEIDYTRSRWLLGFDQRRQLDFFSAIVGELSPARRWIDGIGGCEHRIIPVCFPISHLVSGDRRSTAASLPACVNTTQNTGSINPKAQPTTLPPW